MGENIAKLIKIFTHHPVSATYFDINRWYHDVSAVQVWCNLVTGPFVGWGFNTGVKVAGWCLCGMCKWSNFLQSWC